MSVSMWILGPGPPAYPYHQGQEMSRFPLPIVALSCASLKIAATASACRGVEGASIRIKGMTIGGGR